MSFRAEFTVPAGLRNYSYSEHFERRIELGTNGDVTVCYVSSPTCGCGACKDRVEVFKAGLAHSGALHEWTHSYSLVLPGYRGTTPVELASFLGHATGCYTKIIK